MHFVSKTKCWLEIPSKGSAAVTKWPAFGWHFVTKSAFFFFFLPLPAGLAAGQAAVSRLAFVLFFLCFPQEKPKAQREDQRRKGKKKFGSNTSSLWIIRATTLLATPGSTCSDDPEGGITPIFFWLFLALS
jgi:hypothetical protein